MSLELADIQIIFYILGLMLAPVYGGLAWVIRQVLGLCTDNTKRNTDYEHHHPKK